MIVVDSNIIAYLLIPGDKSALAEMVLKKDPRWVAPHLWRSEFRNILTLYMRREGMTVEQAWAAMEKAEEILQGGEFAVSSESILALTGRTNVSAYDAEFVVLAQYFGVKLVTLDKGILREFRSLALSPEAFLRQARGE